MTAGNDPRRGAGVLGGGARGSSTAVGNWRQREGAGDDNPNDWRHSRGGGHDKWGTLFCDKSSRCIVDHQEFQENNLSSLFCDRCPFL